MSGKSVKRERQKMREFAKTMEPLKPILQEAMFEIGDDPEEFLRWAMIALMLYHLNPNRNLEELLPSILQDTLENESKPAPML